MKIEGSTQDKFLFLWKIIKDNKGPHIYSHNHENFKRDMRNSYVHVHTIKYSSLLQSFTAAIRGT